MEAKLSFGLKNGQLVKISQVERGLQCGCICPVCNQLLIARKGNKSVHHFAHYKSLECVGSVETALHMAAKEILERHGKIHLPAVMTSLGYVDGESICLYHTQILYFKRVFLEKRFDRIIPDIIIEVNGRLLIIEITVTHRIDAVKRNRIRKLNISTLEVDLSKFDQLLTIDELEKILIYGLINKKWVYNSKREAFRDEVISYGKALRLYYRNVYKCPLLRDVQHADLLNDCFCCDYFIHANGDSSNSHKQITCIGHAKDDIDKLVTKYKVNI